MERNTRKSSEIANRRVSVTRMLIVFKRTQREIAQSLHVSLGTINSDIKWLNEEWRKKATQPLDVLKGQQLAELAELKHMCWRDGEARSWRILVQIIKLEAQITGTVSPAAFNFNFSILMQLEKAIQDSGMKPDEAFETFKAMFEHKKQEEEIAHDRHEKGDHHQAGQALLDDHANDRH